LRPNNLDRAEVLDSIQALPLHEDEVAVSRYVRKMLVHAARSKTAAGQVSKGANGNERRLCNFCHGVKGGTSCQQDGAHQSGRGCQGGVHV